MEAPFFFCPLSEVGYFLAVVVALVVVVLARSRQKTIAAMMIRISGISSQRHRRRLDRDTLA